MSVDNGFGAGTNAVRCAAHYRAILEMVGPIQRGVCSAAHVAIEERPHSWRLRGPVPGGINVAPTFHANS